MKEPFAFWFSEAVTGFTSLFLSYCDHYKEFDKMENTYNQLQESLRKQGLKDTLKNIENLLNI